MTIRRACLAVAMVTILVGVSAGVAVAQQDDGQVIVVPGDQTGGGVSGPTVDVGVIDPGGPGGDGSAAGGGGGADGSGRGRAPGGSPCRPTGVASGVCVGAINNPGPAGGVVLPSPAELAGQAFDQLRLPLPVPRHSPDVRLADGRSATVVGEQTWLWTERSAWASVSKRVQAGPVWAVVTATPVAMSFDSGMGAGVRCAGPGTPYDRSFGLHAASPDCGFVFTRSSHGMPGEKTTTTYVITWLVTWSGSTGAAPVGGRLPVLQSRATATFAVVEVQALRSG